MDVIEVFADIACPFAHVGLRRFVTERERRGLDRPRLRVRAWPLELVNGKPFDGHALVEELGREGAVAAAEVEHPVPRPYVCHEEDQPRGEALGLCALGHGLPHRLAKVIHGAEG